MRKRGRLAMTIRWQEQMRHPGKLREIVRQATAALVIMDAQRLQELALCCADLNRDLQHGGFRAAGAPEMAQLGSELARNGGMEMEILERVLFETRANLAVFSHVHLQRLRAAGVEPYGSDSYGGDVSTALGILERKAAYGDN